MNFEICFGMGGCEGPRLDGLFLECGPKELRNQTRLGRGVVEDSSDRCLGLLSEKLFGECAHFQEAAEEQIAERVEQRAKRHSQL